MYKPVQVKDILETNKARTKLFINGKELIGDDLDIFKERAEALQYNPVWKYLTNRVEYAHQEMIFEKGNWDSVVKSRAGIYNIREMRKFLQFIIDFK